MYENIRKPKLLKNIPLLLIRGLSPVYYYCKFENNQIPQKVEEIFLNNLHFISFLIRSTGEQLKNNDLYKLSTEFEELPNLSNQTHITELEKLTIKLSKVCNKLALQIEPIFRVQKKNYIDLYNEKVKKLKVLVVDNNKEQERVDKIAKTLQNFCYYDIERTIVNTDTYPQKLIENDFIFYSSTHPSSIHDLVKSLKTYQKPGLAIAYIEKDGMVDGQAIRHGAQLQKSGFQVLYKVFTPIRLFTTIDKIYMKYHLQN